LSEAQLLSICQAPPDDPSREHGLTLRDLLSPDRAPNTAQTPATKAMKRASSISILSGLGVQIPDKTLESSEVSPSQSPTKSTANGKRPSKLRNFFGQRPPSELITTHLAEYFPFTEKKVLERTRRQSMMRAGGPGKRDSVASWNAPAPSRFSV
ncbi:hypothetical MAPKKK, partial [Postia placenta Mad-698-R]